MEIWMDMLTLRDAKTLKRWWERHCPFAMVYRYFIVSSPSNRRFWALTRELVWDQRISR